jgi:hypothetical protein
MTLRKLNDIVSKDPIVKSIQKTSTKFRVSYITGIREVWHFEEHERRILIPPDPFTGKPIHIRPEHIYLPIDDDAELKKNLICIRYKDYEAGNFIERRLSIQRLVKHVISSDFQIQYTDDDYTKDLSNLYKSNPLKYHVWEGRLKLYGSTGQNYSPGRVLIEGLTSWVENGLRESLKDPFTVYRAINDILKAKKDITFHSILSAMNHLKNARRAGDRFIPPNLYRAIFKQLGLNHQVIGDPQHDNGSKFIAAALEECIYCSQTRSDLSRLSTFLGTEINEFDKESYDVIFADYDFKAGSQAEDLEKWFKLTNTVVMFVPNSMMSKLPKPDKKVQIATNINIKKVPDYICRFM